jgi:hypothetical protein
MIFAASSFSDCIGFVLRHPGLLLVLIGVAGEIICDWKDMEGRLARAKKLSAILLVVGLTMEFWEAAKSDEEIAKLKLQTADSNLAAQRAAEESGQANERAANTESNNLVLQTRLIELENKIKPRTITPQQRIQFITLLKNAPKSPVGLYRTSDNTETGTFKIQVGEMLESAGYPIHNGSSSDIIKGSSVEFFPSQTTGASVFFVLSTNHIIIPEVSLATPAYVDALQNAFSGIGIDTALMTSISDLGISGDQVLIIITENRP